MPLERENVIYNFDLSTKKFMGDGLCAALTCAWLRRCHDNQLMPLSDLVDDEGFHQAVGPEDDGLFWFDVLRAQQHYKEHQLSRQQLVERHRLHVVKRVVGNTAPAAKLIDTILASGDGYSYFGLDGTSSGHAIGIGVFPGLARLMNPEYGEVAFTNRTQFREHLEEYFEEDYPTWKYKSFELLMVVGA
jgi:hypothetical protein